MRRWRAYRLELRTTDRLNRYSLLPCCNEGLDREVESVEGKKDIRAARGVVGRSATDDATYARLPPYRCISTYVDYMSATRLSADWAPAGSGLVRHRLPVP